MAAVKKNWFDIQLMQLGPDFINKLSPERIQRQAKTRIFREMITNQINYKDYEEYITNEKIFGNLYQAAIDEYESALHITNALAYYDMYEQNHKMGTPSTTIGKLIYNQRCRLYIYWVICTALEAMKYNNMNIDYLSDIASKTIMYKHEI